MPEVTSSSAHTGTRIAASQAAPQYPRRSLFSTIGHDAPAGLVVFLVALPLCLGISLASGAPLLAGVMALLAAGFSMRQTRRGGVAQMIASGVAAGFALFVISKVAEEFGQSGSIPPVLAAWAPAVSGLLMSVSLLLHLEDG